MAAFFLFAITDLAAKISVEDGFPVLAVVFMRYAANFALVLVLFLPHHGRNALKSNVPHLQMMRGATLLASTMLNFLALKYLPLTVTIPILFAVPLIVCLLSVPILGERVGLRRFIAVIVGFIGVLTIVRPGGVGFHWAMLISVGASTGAALYFIFTRMVAGRDEMPVGQIYISGGATLVLLPFVWQLWVPPQTFSEWTFLAMTGICAGLGHAVLTIAYRYQDASKLTPLVYTEIIYITIISWVLFDDLPDFWTVIGTAIIITSGIYVWLRERQSA